MRDGRRWRGGYLGIHSLIKFLEKEAIQPLFFCCLNSDIGKEGKEGSSFDFKEAAFWRYITPTECLQFFHMPLSTRTIEFIFSKDTLPHHILTSNRKI